MRIEKRAMLAKHNSDADRGYVKNRIARVERQNETRGDEHILANLVAVPERILGSDSERRNLKHFCHKNKINNKINNKNERKIFLATDYVRLAQSRITLKPSKNSNKTPNSKASFQRIRDLLRGTRFKINARPGLLGPGAGA